MLGGPGKELRDIRWSALVGPLALCDACGDEAEATPGACPPARVRQHEHGEGEDAEGAAGTVACSAALDLQIDSGRPCFWRDSQHQCEAVGDAEGEQQTPGSLGDAHLELEPPEPQVGLEVAEA